MFKDAVLIIKRHLTTRPPFFIALLVAVALQVQVSNSSGLPLGQAVLDGVVIFALLFTAYRFVLFLYRSRKSVRHKLIGTTVAYLRPHKKIFLAALSVMVLCISTTVTWYFFVPHFHIEPPKGFQHATQLFEVPFIIRNNSLAAPKHISVIVHYVHYDATITYMNGSTIMHDSDWPAYKYGHEASLHISPMVRQDFNAYPIRELLMKVVLSYEYFFTHHSQEHCFRLTRKNEYGDYMWNSSMDCWNNAIVTENPGPT